MRQYKKVLVLILCFQALAAALSAETMNQYCRFLDGISRDLQRASDAEKVKAGAGQPYLDNLAERLPASYTVQTEKSSISVDLSGIKRSLNRTGSLKGRSRNESINKLIDQVRTMTEVCSSERTSNHASILKARKTLTDVLAQSEYKPNPLDALSIRIRNFILNLLDRLDVPPKAADVVFWIVIGGAALACIIGLYLLIKRLIERYYSEDTSSPAGTREKIERPAKRTLESLMEDSQRAAAEGRYREALRFIYLASLLLLDRYRLINYIESGTNWEYVRALRRQSAGETAEVLQSLTRIFDESIYGRRNISSDDYQNSLKHFHELEALV